MSELELKPIPNIVNVNDIQEIIDTNKILSESLKSCYSTIERKDKQIEELNGIIKRALDYLEENKKESELQIKGEPKMYIFNGRIFDLLNILNGK